MAFSPFSTQRQRKYLSLTTIALLTLTLIVVARLPRRKDYRIPQIATKSIEHTTHNNDSTMTGKWSHHEIVAYMKEHPQRAYFSRLFRDGGFRSGIEMGVAGGRFSEHFLMDNVATTDWTWTMIEPFPLDELKSRLHQGWPQLRILSNVQTYFHVAKSLDEPLLKELPDQHYDFIYLDGNHQYKFVRKELPIYWEKVASGGVLAGHDYCNGGEPPIGNCKGCSTIPLCGVYTEYGVAHGKPNGKVQSQQGVVRAVQEWLSQEHPEVEVYHTVEDFTRESLQGDGMDYDLVITGTRNPSWFIVKP